jgi:hypothetical protein
MQEAVSGVNHLLRRLSPLSPPEFTVEKKNV